MKIVLMILAATALTACGATHFGTAENDQKLSSTNEEPSDNSRLDEIRAEIEQPAEPPPGTAPTYEQAQCDWARKNQSLFVSVNDGYEINGAIGNQLLKGRHIKEVKDFTGNLIFLGTTDDAKIDVIRSTIGNVIVCNADIGLLEAVSFGNVIVVGGSVGQISGFIGNVVGLPGTVSLFEKCGPASTCRAEIELS